MKNARAHCGLSIAFLAIVVTAQGSFAARHPVAPIWISTWGASQQIPEPRNTLPPEDLTDATVRQIFHVSVGGSVIRVHVSNAFGTTALHFTSVHIAKPVATNAPAIVPGTDQALTFAGAAEVTVPAGAEFVSDPIGFPLAPLSDVAVTYHLDDPPLPETSHPGSRATSYYVRGDQVSAATLDNPGRIDHWYQVSEIDVQAPAGAAVVSALGDSITDGHGATTNGNDRWTDVLAARLQQSPGTDNIGVSNQGIGGNHLLIDGLGPNALSRFDRDVLAPPGVRWLIVFEGVNDLGELTHLKPATPADDATKVERIIAAYEQIILRAHAHGIQVFGATITPFGGSFYSRPDIEADRQKVNDWIRTPGHFDAVIDFDQVVRDPQQTDRLLPAYDCGDHLHPSPAGYKAMGDAIPLAWFGKQPSH